MLERDVIRGVIKEAKRLGVEHIRMTMMTGTSSGWPDYCFLLQDGKTLWIEFKRPRGKPTVFQQFRIDTLRSLGHYVHVVDDIEKGVHILREAAYGNRVL